MVLSKTRNNKGPDQSARMHSLVCAFVVHKPPKTAFLASRLSWEYVVVETFGEIICFRKKLRFEDFLLYFSSQGGHFVRRSRIICAIFEEFLNGFVFSMGQQFRCHSTIFLVLWWLFYSAKSSHLTRVPTEIQKHNSIIFP